jgi:archaemetzincin
MPMRLPLALLPFQGMDERTMLILADQLAHRGFACTLLPEVAVPPDAYNHVRDQYRVERLLEATRQAVAGRVLGVVDLDLYAEGLNFVFGMADTPGRAAVISVSRLHDSIAEARFQARVFKEAVHELGHTLGLAHCQHAKCVMYFSNTLADTDHKGADFCVECRTRLEALEVDS